MAFLSRQTLGKKLHCSVMENLNRELLVFLEKTASNGLSDKKSLITVPHLLNIFRSIFMFSRMSLEIFFSFSLLINCFVILIDRDFWFTS